MISFKILFFVQLETLLGRLNPNKLIDMTAIINARLMTPADFLWSEDIMGLRLVADGANQFKGISINLRALLRVESLKT